MKALILQSGWEVKNVKSFQGRDGLVFNLSLYYQGKRVAVVQNDGWGGENHYEWLDKSLEVPFAEFAKGFRWVVAEDKEKHGFDLVYNADMMIDDLIAIFDIKKACKRKTCYRVNGQNDDEYMSVNIAYFPGIRERLEAKHSAGIEIIFNEFFNHPAGAGNINQN